MNDDLDPQDPFASVRQASQAYRADSARMWRRVESAMDAETRRGPSPRRTGLVLAVAASTALVILASAQFLGRTPSEPSPAMPATSTVVASGTVAPTASRTATARPGTTTTATPSATGPAGNGPGAARSATNPAPTAPAANPTAATPAPTTSPRQDPTAPGNPPGPSAVATRWTALPAGAARTVTLPLPNTLDWVHPGARADLKAQRAKHPASDQRLALDVPDRSTSRSGPLTVSWTDAVPEQERSGVTGWLVTPIGSTVSIAVPASTTSRHLLVWLAGNGTPFTVDVVPSGGSTTSTTVTGAPAGTQPSLLTVDLPAGNALVVRLNADSGAGPTGLSVGPIALTR